MQVIIISEVGAVKISENLRAVRGMPLLQLGNP